MVSSLVFKVRRSEAVLVKPALPTPIEVKSVSDYDNKLLELPMECVILLYKSSGRAMDNRDPAEMIKRALAEALVYYYPWAGKLKEGQDGKLVVDCTAEGVVFVEANADVRLDQFKKDSLGPPFPCIEELLYTKYPGTALGSPLFTMQVTRLLCGGFILAFTFNHVISDGIGAAQFLNAIAEIANGAHEPSVLPIWDRELLNAREPPPPALHNTTHSEMASELKPPNPDRDIVVAATVCRTVFFGKREVAIIRSRIPEHLRDSCTSFELIVAFVLHCRVISLQHKADEQAGVLFPVNCRNKFVDPPIPAGYYGNVSFHANFTCPKNDLHDLGCAVEHVKKAKDAVNEGYARSTVESAVKKRRSVKPSFPDGCTIYGFNDWSRIGFSTLHFGSWGKPVFAGKPYNVKYPMNLMLPFTNFVNGEEGRLLNLCMPEDDMDNFLVMLQILLDPTT